MASSTIAYVLLPFLGVVLQGTTSITYVIVNDLIHPERTAQEYSMIYATSSLASVIGPLGFGHIGDIWGIAIIAIAPCRALKISQPMARQA